MTSKRDHWSYSSINQYLRCPLQYYFERVLKLPRKSIPSAMVMGSAIHAGLAEFHRALQHSEDPSNAHIRDIIVGSWKKSCNEKVVDFKDGNTQEELIRQSIDLVELYTGSERPTNIRAVELPFWVPIITSSGNVLEKPLLAVADLIVEREPGMMKEFIQSMSRQKIGTCLMEGTHIGLPNGSTKSEFEIESEFIDVLKKSEGLILMSFSPQHIDRLVGCIRAAKQSQRILVVDAYTAFVLYLLSTEIKVPTVELDENMRIMMTDATRNKLSNGKLAKLRESWESKLISRDEIMKTPDKFAMMFPGSLFKSVFEGRFPERTDLVYSRWSGYLEQIGMKEIAQAISDCGGTTHQIHTSGHIFDFDIPILLKQLRTKSVVPIHTFEPDQLRQKFGQISGVT